jgi:hypothetical protein
LHTVSIEHCDCLSWFSRKSESHKQDGETLSAQQGCKACQRLAILPWPPDLPAMRTGIARRCDWQHLLPGK